MHTEFEVRILNIDIAETEKKLSVLNAIDMGQREMRRYTYDIDPDNHHKWIRLRDNGEKITLTIKEIVGDGVDGTREIETTVGDFNHADQILEYLGYKHKAYQENHRHSYELDGVQIEIDKWPLIPPYMEIEGSSKDEVQKIVEKLGFQMSDTVTLDVQQVFLQKYNIDIDDYPELTFQTQKK